MMTERLARKEDTHKEKLRCLGRFAAQLAGILFLIAAALVVNLAYTPRIPWFVVVLLGGAFVIVSKARKVMALFDA
ncbi:hypothetical protein [Varunaivibrio sulfuroxidans]|uniref:Uncharacterized protein n=1 Tax=Varunaivibrio sulfuroxidans TaxID=1773489 RepID=A0A4R3J8C3_9PROT|nr:hypothetical protein [Varunaivibrio sulfuroxidans]TCS62088.1 hypothetical protein EDD55_10642 [Varunaivibrio sulfuroxidans]WES30521.1 hypothetical protein P3M64_12895 [Varunaivibrio sulfuroxidans]